MNGIVLTNERLQYQKVMDYLEKEIREGKCTPGNKLPPLKSISSQMGMNLGTVRRAMLELAQKGVLEIRPRVGTFIANQAMEAASKTLKIALVYGDYFIEVHRNHPAIGTFLAGAHQRCRAPESMIQSFSFRKGKFVEDVGEALVQSGTQGIILTSWGMTSADMEFLVRNRIRLVDCVEKTASEQALSLGKVVSMDSNAALILAVEHLRILGHQRIAFIAYGCPDEPPRCYREFARLAFDHQLGNPSELLTTVANPHGTVHWEDVEKFFSIAPLPSAVIVEDEYVADVLFSCCRRRGIRVPEDLSVVAIQDLLPFNHWIPITSLYTSQDLSHMIWTACDHLIKQIKGEPISPEPAVIQPRLTLKASSAPFHATK